MENKNLYDKVAVVILNYNGVKLFDDFLPSVIKNTPLNIEITVIDNASTDNSVNYLKSNFPTIKLILNNLNLGFSEGYNVGLQKIDAKYYVLLNSDVEVTENWLQPMLNFINQNNNVAVVQPKILSYLNKNEFEYAGGCGGFVDRFFYPFCRGRILNKIEIDKGQYNDKREIFWASGAAFLIRADLFHKIGGFDKYFFAHQEEIDLCWRLQRLGYKCFVIPESKVYHLGGGTLDYSNLKKVYLNHRNSLIMITKNLPPFKAFKIVFSRIIIEQICEGLNQLIKGNFKYWKTISIAHIDYIKWLFKSYKKNIDIPYINKKKLYGYINKFLIIEYYIFKNKNFNKL